MTVQEEKSLEGSALWKHSVPQGNVHRGRKCPRGKPIAGKQEGTVRWLTMIHTSFSPMPE